MARLSVKEIWEHEIALIERHPQGIRFAEIWRWFKENYPDTPDGTLAASLANVVAKYPERVRKISRGLYAPASDVAAEEVAETATKVKPPPSLREQAVYEPFARFLENDLEEVTSAEPLGGSPLRTKWGSPDVIGVYRRNSADPIEFPLEIVSAEIKAASDQAVVAFGQAISFRLFSHKVYIVVPAKMDRDELDRLQALCLLFGIGLVTYTEADGGFDFDIRSRALRFEPDSYFMNTFAKQINQYDEKLFRRLFP